VLGSGRHLDLARQLPRCLPEPWLVEHARDRSRKRGGIQRVWVHHRSARVACRRVGETDAGAGGLDAATVHARPRRRPATQPRPPQRIGPDVAHGVRASSLISTPQAAATVPHAVTTVLTRPAERDEIDREDRPLIASVPGNRQGSEVGQHAPLRFGSCAVVAGVEPDGGRSDSR